jgi:hypothetical protein
MNKITLPADIVIDRNNNNNENNDQNITEEQQMTTELTSITGVSSSFLLPNDEP